MAKKLLLSTRKGLFIYEKAKKGWKLHSLSFEGVPVSFSHYEPTQNRLWACLDHGHWAQKLNYSPDFGATWKEVNEPKYPEDAYIKKDKKATLKYLWCMTSDKEKLYIGTEPGGLFTSDLDGNQFQLNEGLWNHPSRLDKWQGGGRDNPGIHSILIDPRDTKKIKVGISCAGMFESSNGGKTWYPKNKGCTANFLPDPNAEIGQDPHLIEFCQSSPDTLWQQNHCGIFKSDDDGNLWQDVSQKEGPANFGFTIQVDEEDPKMAFVIPGKADINRVAFNNQLMVCQTVDGGQSWQIKNKGLPNEKVYDIVYRHGFSKNKNDLVFGTTTGNVFYSENKGDSWEVLSNYLPMIYAVKIVEWKK